MKPKPTSCTQRATCSGPRSIRPPRASSTSALPQRLVAERLPCLATAAPAAEARIPAAVETLNVPALSPPVPHVSRACAATGSARCTCTAFSRMIRASPAISWTVSPPARRRKAVRKAPIWAWVATPVMISSMTAAASSSLRVAPAVICAIASRIIDCSSLRMGSMMAPSGMPKSCAAGLCL